MPIPGGAAALLNRKIPRALLQFLDGTLLVSQRLMQRVADGDTFISAERAEDVASGASAYFLFENPPGSGVYANIIILRLGATGQGRANFYTPGRYEVVSEGSAVPAVNLNFGSGNSAKCRLRVGGSYSLGAPALREVVPGGSHIRAVGETVVTDINARLAPGQGLLVEIVNTGASAADYSCSVKWWEEEVS